ncbi:NAD(P)/FAD-dependent oxidoreductase [Arthrobacter psychrochitiniphilus]|uniref:NAD(P)/FAD-dependent oxidoreductase n=1 Tax=Arthrobacter psychrochitiniphilus TaxID=291045 RepID=UPI0014760EE4|nr:NAD(P)/FAD-dependent oxidoreductase [Arthrobacter psychrochitiniphilus]NYG16146.1 glycine/D-amino acid oxidase-like deaminating enzyme [Arthrobacter psychrochitiniphilus]
MKVIVIGAGLAGLRAAGLAAKEGHDVTVLEASQSVGGRVDTELIDGFRCDRGFQLINPSYPDAQAALNLNDLDLHPSGRGVAIRNGSGVQVLADPFRHPAYLKGLLGGTLTLGDVAALIRWNRLARSDSLTLQQTIDSAGFSLPLRKVIEQFFSGVVADPDLKTVASSAQTLAWYFVKGIPSLPAQGMEAVAHQLAEPILEHIRFSTPVESLISHNGQVRVVCSSGEELIADRVVVAAGPRTSARLTGQPEPTMNSLTTWWFDAAHRPSKLPFLYLDVREESRLIHTSVISNICPSYAPAGRHLVQATAVGAHGLEDSEAMAQAASIMGVHNPDWRLLVRHDIVNALPCLEPGQRPLESGIDGVIIAGDTTEPSIQGALASGVAAARALGSPTGVLPARERFNDTFTLRIRCIGDASGIWEKLTNLDNHTRAIPLTVVTPAQSRMIDGLEFVGLTSLGPVKMADRMLVRRAEAPTPGKPGLLQVSKFGPVAGEVEASIAQLGSEVEVIWRQSLQPAWLPRWLRPLGTVVARAGYSIGLRKLLT